MTHNWHTMHNQVGPHDTIIKAGMWLNDDRVYFTVEGLSPDMFFEHLSTKQDLEFEIKIKDLERIVNLAKRNESTAA